MKLSTDRILTTHVGSLPRPKPLLELIMAKEQGGAVDQRSFEAESVRAVDETVAQQVASGIDIVSDGEMSKLAYTLYVRHRVTGMAMSAEAAEKGRQIMIGLDRLDHPDFGDRSPNFAAMPLPSTPCPHTNSSRRSRISPRRWRSRSRSRPS